jgi:LuxR family maltose regulon positive regulatory protein
MAIPLLKTKLYVPLTRPDRVPRPRLIERLEEGLRLGCKLTLLSAPAGFGKTTLLAEWMAALERSPADEPSSQVCWLALDYDDNDPIRFLTYLIAALSLDERIGHDVLSSLQAFQSQSASVQALLAACINRIDAIDRRIVLVLDDYHLITSSEVHEAVRYLLGHMPHNLHLVIATRADPPLYLARLRGRGQLTELRQADLSFSASEVAAFVRHVTGLELSPDDVAALAKRTEGWAAGLQMAALAAQGKEAARLSAFLATFTGRHEHIVDYFADEVLGGQAESVRTFLLQTSILERLCGPLCDAVCGRRPEDAGRRDGQQLLERLQEANLFVVPLDDERRWYRYHHLFADLLRQRLLQSEAALIPELHRRASQWYDQNSFLEEAIDHALRGDDMDRAARLIERAGEAILMRGELATLATWLEALPHELVRVRPLLSLYYAGALLLSGEPPGVVREYLQIAATEGVANAVTHGALALRALLALWQGDIAASVALGEQVLGALPKVDPFWRGIVAGNLGIAYLVDGVELDRASRMLSEAVRAGERAGNLMGQVIALCNLAEVHIIQGQLGTAKNLYDRALALAVDDRGKHLPIAGMAVVGAATLFHEWNELDKAESLLAVAMERPSERLPIWAMDGFLALARLKHTQGDVRAARAALAEARAVADSTSATVLDDWMVAAAEAGLGIDQGDLEFAASWARSRGLFGGSDAVRSGLPYAIYELEELVLAELRIAQGEARLALDLLQPLLSSSSALHRTDGVIKILVLTALVHQQLGDLDASLTTLTQALAAARAGGYVRTFLDRGPPMYRLLRQALAQGIAVHNASRILDSVGEGASPTSPYAEDKRLVEPLSEREQQVLRLLSTHLTSAEIGDELYISVHTVRFHTKNIYAKLSVHSRSDAVDRARKLGLL